MRAKATKGVVVLVVALALGWTSAWAAAAHRQNALQRFVAENAKLAAVPETASNVTADESDGHVVCSITVSFDDTPEHIERWRAASPSISRRTRPAGSGPMSFDPDQTNNRGAQVKIDYGTGRVSMHVAVDECP